MIPDNAVYEMIPDDAVYEMIPDDADDAVADDTFKELC